LLKQRAKDTNYIYKKQKNFAKILVVYTITIFGKVFYFFYFKLEILFIIGLKVLLNTI